MSKSCCQISNRKKRLHSENLKSNNLQRRPLDFCHFLLKPITNALSPCRPGFSELTWAFRTKSPFTPSAPYKVKALNEFTLDGIVLWRLTLLALYVAAKRHSNRFLMRRERDSATCVSERYCITWGLIENFELVPLSSCLFLELCCFNYYSTYRMARTLLS